MSKTHLNLGTILYITNLAIETWLMGKPHLVTVHLEDDNTGSTCVIYLQQIQLDMHTRLAHC